VSHPVRPRPAARRSRTVRYARRRRRLRGTLATVAALVLLAAGAHHLLPARGSTVVPAGCGEPSGIDADAVAAAARLASDAGLRGAVAVLDTTTGGCLVAGDVRGEFATASLVKVMIAARLLVTGQMTGPVAGPAREMIARSDDAAANALWAQAGGADLEPWIEQHYDLPDLGSPNRVEGRWGNTHVTASGMAQLYARLRADPAVWPWLSAAMHEMSPLAADGTDQRFGVAAALPGSAVKQGWADGSADDPADAVVNSSGFVASDRYVVVLLTEGDGNVAGCDRRGFHPGQAAVVTAMAGALDGTLGAAVTLG
jgi:hypothetical protein